MRKNIAKTKEAKTPAVALGIRLGTAILSNKPFGKIASALESEYEAGSEGNRLSSKAFALYNSAVMPKANMPWHSRDDKQDELSLKKQAFNFLVFAFRAGFKVPMNMEEARQQLSREFHAWNRANS